MDSQKKIPVKKITITCQWCNKVLEVEYKTKRPSFCTSDTLGNSITFVD